MEKKNLIYGWSLLISSSCSPIYTFFVLVPQSGVPVSIKLEGDNNREMEIQTNSPVVLLKAALDVPFNQTTALNRLNWAVESIGL